MHSRNEKFLHVLYLSVTTDTFNSWNLLQLIGRINTPLRYELLLGLPLHSLACSRPSLLLSTEEVPEGKNAILIGMSQWNSNDLVEQMETMGKLEEHQGEILLLWGLGVYLCVFWRVVVVGRSDGNLGLEPGFSVKSHLSLLGLHLKPLKSVTCRNAHWDFCRIFCGRKALGYFNRASFVHWMIIQEDG